MVDALSQMQQTIDSLQTQLNNKANSNQIPNLNGYAKTTDLNGYAKTTDIPRNWHGMPRLVVCSTNNRQGIYSLHSYNPSGGTMIFGYEQTGGRYFWTDWNGKVTSATNTDASGSSAICANGTNIKSLGL